MILKFWKVMQKIEVKYMWSLDGDKKMILLSALKMSRGLNHPTAKSALYIAHRAPNNTNPA